jgi:hypothetical protein
LLAKLPHVLNERGNSVTYKFFDTLLVQGMVRAEARLLEFSKRPAGFSSGPEKPDNRVRPKPPPAPR